MLSDFFTPFVAVGLAELGDKTQLALILLASKTDKRLQLFLGALIGFFIVDGLAILLGSILSDNVPMDLIKYGSASVFILFGVIMLRSVSDEKEDMKMRGNAFTSSFLLITLTEMGDKTQIAAGLFATQYSILPVLAGTMCALAILSITAIMLGQKIAKHIDAKKTGKIAGLLFISIGFATLIY